MFQYDYLRLADIQWTIDFLSLQESQGHKFGSEPVEENESFHLVFKTLTGSTTSRFDNTFESLNF